MAWLDTLDKDTIQTIREAPKETIVPAALTASGARAMSLLQAISSRAMSSSLQLHQGEIIGEGGMGVVRAAEQVALGRTVAVKTLKRKDPGAALDLLREAWVTGSIEHPNVVPVHYVELDDAGMPLVVLKRIEGVEWSKLLESPDEVLSRFGARDHLAWHLGTLMQVLNAIRYAHHKGVIHRDLKPSNVMIGNFGEVYLLDWGIAVSLVDDGSGRLPLAVNATELAGTPAYMAPEMLGRDGGPPQSERTDIYLAGSVLFEVIAGHPPHLGTNLMSVIASVIASEPRLPDDVPPELATICRRAMHEAPAQRYDSAEAMRLALQAYLEHRGSAELALRARVRADELATMIASGTAERDAIYRLFGACRFGFIEALSVWPGNDAARRHLDRATIAVAEYELASDDPAAALALLADIDAPEITARAQAAAIARADKLAALEDHREQHDPTTGRRTRTFIAGALGALFTIIPAAGLQNAYFDSHREHVLWSAVFTVLLVSVGLWSRRTIMSTLYNRRVFGSFIFLFGAQTLFAVGGWIMDIEPMRVEVTFLFLWGMCSAILAITVSRGLAVAAVAYFACFLVAARWPEHRNYLIAIGNFVFTITAMWLWWPRGSFHPTMEERERFGMRKTGLLVRTKARDSRP